MPLNVTVENTENGYKTSSNTIYNLFQQCNNLKTIGNNAFNNCKFISSITLSSSVTSIGESAFSNCEKLSAVNIGSNGNLVINKWAFTYINKDAKFSIPYSTKIGSDETFIDNVFTKGNTVFCSDPSKIDTSLVETNNLNNLFVIVFFSFLILFSFLF